MSGIKCAVGRNGANLPNDVKTIQILLNDRRNDSAALAGAYQPLAEDRKCGQLTIAAIRAFQHHSMGWSQGSCDGKVDTNGKTIRALNGNIASQVNTKPAVDVGLGMCENGFGGGMSVPAIATAVAKVTAADKSDYTSFKQGNYKQKIGNSKSSTISGIGCALCTLTMAATSIGSRTTNWPKDLKPSQLTPPKANDIIKKASGFSGGLLYMKKAAEALGIDYDEYGFTSSLQGTELSRIATHMSKGLPVAANVDYKKTDKGDHWVLLNVKNGDGSYGAIDPSYGKTMKFRAPKAETENVRYAEREDGERKGILVGWPDNGGSSSQQKYIVVRFALLSKKVNSQL